MKYTAAWAQVASENFTLKIVTAALTFIALGLATGLTMLALEPPMVFERGCHTSSMKPASTKRTEAEIKKFVELSLAERFNTDTPSLGYVSSGELQLRNTEQTQLSQRKMRQQLIINEIEVSENKVSVDADRLIAVNEIRSVFRFPLVVNLSTVSRSESNPYGLKLDKVAVLSKEDQKK